MTAKAADSRVRAKMYVLSNYDWPLPEPDLEQDAQRIAEAVLRVLRDNGDNLAVLAAIRRALVEK